MLFRSPQAPGANTSLIGTPTADPTGSELPATTPGRVVSLTAQGPRDCLDVRLRRVVTAVGPLLAVKGGPVTLTGVSVKNADVEVLDAEVAPSTPSASGKARQPVFLGSAWPPSLGEFPGTDAAAVQDVPGATLEAGDTVVLAVHLRARSTSQFPIDDVRTLVVSYTTADGSTGTVTTGLGARYLGPSCRS